MITLTRFAWKHPVVTLVVLAAGAAITVLARRATPQVQAEATVWRQRLGQLHHDDDEDRAGEA